MNETFVVAMRRATRAFRWPRLDAAGRALRHMLTGTPSAPAESARETRSGDWPGARAANPPGFAEDEADWQGGGNEAAGTARPEARLPLGEAVRILREGHDRLAPAEGLREARGRPVEIPEGAGFHKRRFACEAGARDYRLYLPRLDGSPAAGLIVMLHACSQSPEDFAYGTGMNALAEEHGLIVAYPEQAGEFNAMQCWNWFRRSDQARGAGEPAILAGLARTLATEFAVPEGRVFAAGLSAGGAMAAILAETYPELFAAVGVHSGVAPGVASDVLSAFAAMRGEFLDGGRQRGAAPSARLPRLIVFHGEADRMVHPANARRLIGMAHVAFPAGLTRTETGISDRGRGYRRLILAGAAGAPLVESWSVAGVGHAWSGGRKNGPHTDPEGPDASRAMVRFFLGTA